MKKTFITLFLFFFSLSTFSQIVSDSVTISQELSQQLATYERLLTQSNQQHKEDSLARVQLMKHIQRLQESKKSTQVSLQEQVREIEEKDSLRNIKQKQRILEPNISTKGFNVAPFQDSLFVIFTKLGPVMAKDRASNVTKKIEILTKDDFFFKDSLYVEEHEGTLDIMYRNLIVTSISDWDALWIQGKDKKTLANIYKKQIVDFVMKTHNKSIIKNVAARIGLVFLILGGVALVLYFIGRLAGRIQEWMVRKKGQYFTGIKIRSFEILSPSLHLDVNIRGISILKWAIYMLIFYLSLPMIFGLFPFTRGWAKTLMDWILSPAKNIWYGFWNYLPNIFTIAVIYLITRYLLKGIKFISTEVESERLNLPGFYSDWARPTYRLVKFVIYAFMLVMIYPYLPSSESDIFKGVFLFLVLIISFGSISSIANAVAGLIITYVRPFHIGDSVKIGDVTGEIIKKDLFVTRVRTEKNEDITVPNSSILTGHTINYTSSSKELGLILNTSITIGYDVPWRKVHELLIEAAVATDGVNVSKEPFVLQTSLDDWCVSYQLNAYTDVPQKMPKIYSDLHASIQDKFNEASIEIMSPHYRSVRA